MNSAHIRFSIGVLLVALAIMLSGTASAELQKKSKSKPAPAQTPAAPTDETSVEAPAPAVQPTASPVSGAIVDVLKKYQGLKTNLGILKKIGKDYIEIQDESVTWTIPLISIQSLKQTAEKDDNDQPVTRLDIKLYAKD